MRGNEYAWQQNDVKETILEAKKLNLATIGGQPQFRIPGGTCEMYWLNYDCKEKAKEESWEDIVNRSSKECIKLFEEICDKVDFFKEGYDHFEYIRQLMKTEKVDLNKHLYFVIYFLSEREYQGISKKKNT